MNAWGRRFLKTVCLLLLVVGSGVFSAQQAEANIINFKDTISDSRPNQPADHTIEFQTTAEIAAGETITFRPAPGQFSIPAVKYASTSGTTTLTTPDTFSEKNVELFVDSGSGFVQRLTSSSTSATEDGITITSGSNGSVAIELNSGVGIPQNAFIRMRIGRHTAGATTTDLAIVNSIATGSQPYYLEKTGANAVEVRGWVAIVDGVGAGPVDTTEEIPPLRFNGAPTGTLAGTVINVQVSLETNEFATCRYDTASGTPYAAMPNTFDVSMTTFHTLILGVMGDTQYDLYVRCEDDEFNENIDDYLISFYVPEAPAGNAGTPGDNPGSGDGDGTGSGASGSGGGSGGGGGGGSSSNSGSSGGGGGGGAGEDTGSTAGGGFEVEDAPFPSGDGRVVITGRGYPGGEAVILVDGSVAVIDDVNNDGTFELTLDGIARGVYSFSIYGVDRNDVRSSAFTTTFTVTGARSSNLSNINIVPSLEPSENPVDPGDPLTLRGYTSPGASVTVQNQNKSSSASLKTFTATADSRGFWEVDVDTSRFTSGTYQARVKSAFGGSETNYSAFVEYAVGGTAPAGGLPSDYSRDGRVNLTDFSILLFWWGTDGGDSDPPVDVNDDGNVSLTDFSILLFNWTG